MVTTSTQRNGSRPFDPVTFDHIQMELRSRANGRKLIGTSRRYLLTGFTFCGLCGNKLTCSTKQRGANQPKKPAYCCRKMDASDNIVGCDKISRLGIPLEDFVTDVVLYRLDSEGLASILAGLDQDREAITQLMREVETKRLKLADLDTDYATGLLDRKQYARMATLAKDALQDAHEALQCATTSKTVLNLSAGQRVREAWDKADLEWRRNLLSLLIDRVVVNPQVKRPYYKELGRFDPDAIAIEWKC